MKPKHRRMYMLAAGLILLAGAAALVLTALEENIVFFYSPAELAKQDVPAGRRVRIGGLVVEKSLRRLDDGATVEFQITDLARTVKVAYKGVLPDLFREGQGVVAEGVLRPDGVFAATSVLAKHDETYMPPEVADALRKSGRWQGGKSQGGKRK